MESTGTPQTVTLTECKKLHSDTSQVLQSFADDIADLICKKGRKKKDLLN